MARADRFKHRRTAVAVCCGVVVVACGSTESATPTTFERVPDTVDIGAFPERLTSVTVPVVPIPTSAPELSTTTTTTTPRDPITGPIGDEVFGNRMILIGDTSIVATAPRSDGAMCDALASFGWQVEIAAEVGRFVSFGRTVYDARIGPDSDEDWDAVAIMLGNHFDGDVDAYRQDLVELIDAIDPRPTIVYTLVEDDTYQAELNAIIRDLPRFHPNVVIVDWAKFVAAEVDVLAADTPSGLSEEGGRRLALFTAAALGAAPAGDDPGCLEPFFVDDSAIVL